MSTTDLEILPPPTPERQAKAKKATGVAVFGTFIEYYDFSVYGYIAVTLSTLFFPSQDPMVGLLDTMLVFGAAFVVRPLGAIFFGHLGDRFGRRGTLVASITLMCAAAGLTGLLPTYAQIGVFAPILLVILRMLQGFSAGGEIGGASSYIREWASPQRRPLYVSFIPGVAVFGKAAAAGVAAVVATAVPDATMDAWAWRVPFLLAVPMGIFCLFLRLKVEDSPEFNSLQRRDKTQDRRSPR